MRSILLLVMIAISLVSMVWPIAPALAMGGQWGLEFAIDAPWRLEPVRQSDGSLQYGAIPITITFHDAIFDDNRGTVGGLFLKKLHVGRLERIDIMERVQAGPINPTKRLRPDNLREIERKRWISTRQAEPVHELCQPPLGESCEGLLEISESHAWHAMFWYAPQELVTPGRDIHLEVTVITKYRDKVREWKNYLVVHAGDAPLPRFSDRWIYGDFHYHSQMTDNEGESGYSYRNVSRTLGAMGLDFVFATDHASDSNQVDGDITVHRCGNSNGSRCVPLSATGNSTKPSQCKAGMACSSFSAKEARDLNAVRFKAAKNILYGPDGANSAIALDAKLGMLANFNGRQVLPQVYMGEEVDAWPEMSNAEQQRGVISFGDGLGYSWPDNDGCIAKKGLTKCRQRYSEPYRTGDHKSHLVRDEQGVPIAESVGKEIDSETAENILRAFGLSAHPKGSRQHLLYFPFSGESDGRGFVASRTNKFGGATRRLEDLIAEIQGQGVAFLAHPLVGRKPGAIASPDIVPYSRRALNRAWRSPAFLGLQFWNEDARTKSAPTRLEPTIMGGVDTDSIERHNYRLPWEGASIAEFPWHWDGFVGTQPTPGRLFEDLYHGAFTWDVFLRKGLIESQTRGLRWLEPGEPRKWFMAGGSDSHGDFNFRREGRPGMDGTDLEQWSDEPVVDSAIGKPRNLILVDRTRPEQTVVNGSADRAVRYSNRQVINAIQAGRFSVTDGPALRIAIDKNRNGKIDLDDYQMGDTFHLFPGEHVPLLVEWHSTAEFGPLTKVDIYVGNGKQTFAHHRPAGAATFTPLSHGPRDPFNRPEGTANAYADDPSGVLQIDLRQSDAALNGIAKIFLSPKQFELSNQHGQLFYLRAYAQSTGQTNCTSLREPGSCGVRMAYTNPIWGRFIGGCLDDPRSIDSDGDDRADVCTRQITDPCPRPAHEGGEVVATPRTGQPSGPSLPGVNQPLTSPAEVMTTGSTTAPIKPSPKGSCKFVIRL